MVHQITPAPEQALTLFNGPLETGVRSAIVLEAAYPRAFDLAHLTWLDHLVVHTADIGGPPSLHPDIPERTGELLVRRRLVEDGLSLMRRLHMVDAQATEGGFVYQASEEATAFCDSLKTDYGKKLKERARWLANHFFGQPDEHIAALVKERIGQWAEEFQGEGGPESTQS